MKKEKEIKVGDTVRLLSYTYARKKCIAVGIPCKRGAIYGIGTVHYKNRVGVEFVVAHTLGLSIRLKDDNFYYPPQVLRKVR